MPELEELVKMYNQSMTDLRMGGMSWGYREYISDCSRELEEDIEKLGYSLELDHSNEDTSKWFWYAVKKED